MKILHVSDLFPPVRGGLEGHVDDLAAAQATTGHDVHVATLTAAPTAADPSVTTHVVATAAQRVVRYEDAERPFAPPVPDPVARRQLASLVDRLRPDVVHAHGWLGASVPRRRGTAAVLTAHDYALVCHRHTLVRADGTPCAGPTFGGCLDCARRSGHTARFGALAGSTAIGRRMWAVDRIVTLSEYVARRLAPFTRAPIDVCGGLVATDTHPCPEPAGLPSGPFVLFAGDAAPHKGFDVLLDAWCDAALAHVPLVVATTRPLAEPPPGVVAVSFTRPEMRAAWRRASLAVVPSVWPEPFGMVAMEALAAGTPVVASATGALPEVVRDGVDGVLVPPGDARALAAAVRALVGDDDRRLRLAANARAGAARFEPMAVAAKVDAVYERALDAVVVTR